MDKWKQSYHLMPPKGWLNDPNGLYQLNGTYHIFYQYAPESALGGEKCWGHYSTNDFVCFIEEDIALIPDNAIDKDGVYSGSALVKDDCAYFFYTGNIKEKGNYDYIYSGRGHYVNMVTSKDGLHFSKKINLLKNKDYPEDMSCHVRDPKIFVENNIYYMILGARTKKDTACILIYKSENLKDWQFHMRKDDHNHFGYMWECPDLFELNKQKILIVCPQGVEQDHYKYENIYQNGYFIVDGSLSTDLYLHDFFELDKGFDFYAPQTFEDEQGRRILIAWMGLPDIPYSNPTVQFGWQHTLTLPRQLTFKDNRIFQYPIEEIKQLRGKCESFMLEANRGYCYKKHACEIHLKPKTESFNIKIRRDVRISYQQGVLILSLKESGYGRDERHAEIKSIEDIDIYSDQSSLEIFINKGEVVFSTRVYDDVADTWIELSDTMHITIYELNSYQIKLRNNSI